MNSPRHNAQDQAVLYTRVSTEEQVRHGVSLEAQEERLRAYCQSVGIRIAGVICEQGISGSIPIAKRPGGARVQEYIKRGATHVVALKLDRLFRDAADALNQTREWDRNGIALHLVDMGGQSMNTASAMGRMMLTMMAAYAELERNLIAERTTAALQHKKAHGRVFNHEPFGYRREGDLLVSLPEEQAIIERVNGWRLGGWTLQRIAETLNEDGIPTKRAGGKWYPSTVKNLLESGLKAA